MREKRNGHFIIPAFQREFYDPAKSYNEMIYRMNLEARESAKGDPCRSHGGTAKGDRDTDIEMTDEEHNDEDFMAFD